MGGLRKDNMGRRVYMGFVIVGKTGQWLVEGVEYKTLAEACKDIKSWWDTKED